MLGDLLVDLGQERAELGARWRRCRREIPARRRCRTSRTGAALGHTRHQCVAFRGTLSRMGLVGQPVHAVGTGPEPPPARRGARRPQVRRHRPVASALGSQIGTIRERDVRTCEDFRRPPLQLLTLVVGHDQLSLRASRPRHWRPTTNDPRLRARDSSRDARGGRRCRRAAPPPGSPRSPGRPQPRTRRPVPRGRWCRSRCWRGGRAPSRTRHGSC